MNRRTPITGIPPQDLRLWRFNTQLIVLPAINTVTPLFSDGTKLCEFLLIEADLRNADYVSIGANNAIQNFPASSGTKAVVQLAAGEWCCWQSEETEFLDRIDGSTMYVLSGPTVSGVSIHVTVGSRGR